jgi:hypothetical protein
MSQLKIICTRFENNYSNNTCQSSENVASIVHVLRNEINFYTKTSAKFSFALH